MAGNRTLKLSILADVDDLKKKLGQGEKEVEGFGNKLGEFGKKAAAAFAVAAAAAAAYAGKLLVDGVKAAIEDEKAQVKLAQTLENTTGATREQIKAVEDQILKMSLATGVADDKLRPSFEKLVRATNDVAQAQKLQTLALDIAAGSGKDLETVSVALAKAYDGNNSSLTRLGVGLSAAELKSLSFDQVTAKLADTFGGQASVQADTFSGKMARMQVAFDEAKESVGARLLPILTQLLDTFNTKVGPAVQAIQDKLKPLTKAIDDNKEEFTALWNFLNKYIVPIMAGALKNAFSGIVTGITAVVSIVGKAINFFQDLYDAYKKIVDFIKNNPLSQFLGKLNPFGNASFSNTGFLTAGGAGGGTGGVDELGRPLGGTTDDNVDAATENKRRNTMWKSETIMRDSAECPSGKGVYLVEYNYYGEVIRQSLNYCVPLIGQNNITSGAGTGVITATGLLTGSNTTTGTTTATPITINVNAPSVIDSEGFTRAVIDALNESQSRTGSLDNLAI
jgi:tetrahydromethanopterin S-methyltransferase subunit B